MLGGQEGPPAPGILGAVGLQGIPALPLALQRPLALGGGRGDRRRCPLPSMEVLGRGCTSAHSSGELPEMWGKVGAESRPRGRPELVPADPLSARGISGIGFSQGHLGQAEGWLLPSLSSLLALSPGHFQRVWRVPCPCWPPSPCSPCVCQGIRFCAILNNSIFIGPTKTYHLLPAHTLPVCVPLTSATGQLALSAFPMPLSPASLCFPPPQKKPGPCPCDAQSARGEGHGAGGASWGHPGDTPGVGRGGGGPAGHPGA